MALIELPPLPFARDALAPAISSDTIDTHYNKHHRAYVEKTNELAKDGDYESLEDIILKTARDSSLRTLFINAAQAWNHERYWESLAPNGGAPSAALSQRIERDLGNLGKLKEDMVKKGVAHFGSGWVSLVMDKGKLTLIDTNDADNALVRGMQPLLVIDLWEHAYYLDYKNQRERHLKAVVDGVLNWRGASERFERLTSA